MKERRYLTSDELSMRSQVINCSGADDGSFDVILTATLFHPQGGGQPSDRGTIAEATVLRVSQAGDHVVHSCDREVALGDAQIEVAPGARSLHARLHSAGHLIGYCGEQFGWRAVKGHHWPGEARVVFEPDAAAREITGDVVQAHVNANVVASLSRNTMIDGNARSIGFGALPAYNCGGTHVASTAEIGKVTISKVKEKKGQLWVYYDVEQ